MKRGLLILALLMALTAACSRRAKLIPPAKMKAIYAEMLLLDQWIGRNWSDTRVADTSLVYGPLLKKHGYSEEDYRKSVAHYMKDPDSFSTMFEDIGKDFTAKAKVLEDKEKLKARLDSVKNVIMSRPFPRPEINVGEIVHTYYGLFNVEKDTLGCYIIKRIEPDTSYQGPRLIIKEVLVQPADSSEKEKASEEENRLIMVKKVKEVQWKG